MSRTILSTLSLVMALSCAARAVTINTTPVGNPGNANDPATGSLYGGVSYAYRIGTTEVTIGQYTEFLNAVAATDTYSLYHTTMATNPSIAGISRSGSSGSYSYSVIASPNRPITYVSWGDAARFANWLHNGQPAGAQGPGTTETGAYTLNGAVTQAALNAVTRNPGATWFIPSENEWYKAAYHQPSAQGGDTDNYWAYPFKSNSTPYSDQPPGATPDNTRVGNFYENDGIANGYNDGYAVTGSTSSPTGNVLTDGGAYTLASTFYGTFDQAGNIFEWNEAIISTTNRGIRGGENGLTSSATLASARFSANPEVDQVGYIGFRVASVPEPSTLALGMFGASGVYFLARKRRR
jgi:formylglycine-generating enzyme